MTSAAGALLAATLLIAALDWIAVGRGDRRLEYLAKPLTMVALIGATLVLEPVDATARTWFVAALVLSLAGDVFLMLPQDLFVPGLASFLLGHVAYIVGLRYLGTSTTGLVVAIAIIAVALPIVGLRVVGAVRKGDEPELLAPVTVYIAVISIMVIAAGASGVAIALAGALLFYASDALIAWTRFIQDLAWGRVSIIVTYHLAQVGLVLALV